MSQSPPTDFPTSREQTRSRLVLISIGVVLVIIGVAPDSFYEQVIELTEPPELRQPIDTSGAAAVEAVISQREAEEPAMQYSPLTPRKGRGMMRSIAFVLFLNAAMSLALARRWFKVESYDPFPLMMGISLIALMTGYRNAIGAGWGGEQLQDGMSGTGFLLNYVDNLSYASWAAQGRPGRLLFIDLFTTEPNAAIYFNPFYIVVGRISRMLGCSVFLVLNSFGAGAAVICIVALYRITRLIGYTREVARWTSVFAAFSSGLTAIMTLAHTTFDLPLLLGNDTLYIDTILSNTFCCWPYQSVAYALFASTIWLTLHYETLEDNSTRKRFTYAALIVLCLALITTHPYEGLLLLGTYGLFFLCTWYRRGDRVRERLQTAIMIASVVVPVTLYNAWIAQQPVWSYFAKVSLADSRPWWSWLIGYGTLLPLAIIGAIRTLRSNNHERGAWIALWLLVAATMLIIVNVPQTTRFCNGLHMPICIMAAVVWQQLLTWSRTQPRQLQHRLTFVGMLLLSPVLFLTAYSMLLYGYRAHRFDPMLNEVAAVLQAESPDDFPRVLTDVRSARMLAVLTPARVFAGHWALTPDYDVQRALLLEGGFYESAQPASSNKASLAAFQELLASAKIDYVVTQLNTPARSFAAESTQLESIATVGTWEIHRLHRDVKLLEVH